MKYDFQKKFHTIFDMCDKENQGMVCYDDIKPIFESMKNMEEFKHCKFNNEKKQKEIFPEDEQFSWRIFYKKLFGLERHSPKVGPQKKEILSIFDEAPELSNNHEETVEKLINNVHSYNFKRCPFYFPPDQMLPTWILRFIKSYNRNYTLQRYTWSGNDKHKFDGTEPDPSIAEVYASAKAGQALLLERFLKIRVIYSIWKIGYLELILSGDEDKIEEAKPYTIYIIGTGFLIFSQYLIRYSIILADKYYRTENGQNMNEYEVIDSQEPLRKRNHKQGCKSWCKTCLRKIYLSLKFLLRYSVIGYLAPVLHDVLLILKPLPELIVLPCGGKALKKLQTFLDERITRDFLGISKENLVAFALADEILGFYMIEIPLLIFQVLALVGWLYIAKYELTEDSEIEDVVGNFQISMEGYVPKIQLSPLFELFQSILVSLMLGLYKIYGQYQKSKAMKEPVLDYLLNGIIGRLGIVPFKRNIMHTFKNNNEGKDEETLSIKYFCCLSIEITKIKRINFNSLCIPSDLSAIIGIGPGDKIEVSLQDKSISQLSLELNNLQGSGQYNKRLVTRPVFFFNDSVKDVQLQLLLSLTTHLWSLKALVDFNDFDYARSLKNSIDKQSCSKGTRKNKVMLYTDANQPILKVLIDGELSPKQATKLKNSKSKPSYIVESKEDVSEIFVKMLKKLVTEHHFDTSATLEDGTSLIDYAQKKDKIQSFKILQEISDKRSNTLGKSRNDHSLDFQESFDLENSANYITQRPNTKYRSKYNYSKDISFNEIEDTQNQAFNKSTKQAIVRKGSILNKYERFQKKIEDKKKLAKGRLTAAAFQYIRELFSFIDLFSDTNILTYLYRMHPSWALLSIGSIIAPFYSSYVPFINYLVRSNNLENRFFLKVFAILPLIIPLNFIIDLFFTILGIFYPIVIFVLNLPVRLVAVFMLLFTCFKSKTGKDWFYNGYFTNKAEKYNHQFIEYLFGMKKNDSFGQKSQRVILQLLLESLFQLFFQLYMFYKIEYDPDQSVISSSVEDSDSDLSFYEIFFSSDFNVYEIVFSIFFGIANVLFVTVQLYGESRALDIDLMKYLFMSLNGRIGFVPFVSRLKNEKFRQERMIDQPLDIENIEGKIGPGSKDGPYNKKGWYKTTEGWLGWFRSLLTFTFIFEFEFDDESVKTFTQAVQVMPIVKKGELPVILFGETLKNTGMDEMYHFLKSCKNRVYPDIEEVAQLKEKDLEEIINNLKQGLEEETTEIYLGAQNKPMLEVFITYNTFLYQIADRRRKEVIQLLVEHFTQINGISLQNLEHCDQFAEFSVKFVKLFTPKAVEGNDGQLNLKNDEGYDAFIDLTYELNKRGMDVKYVEWPREDLQSQILTPIAQALAAVHPSLIAHLNKKFIFRKLFADILVSNKYDINDERFIDNFDQIIDELNKINQDNKQGQQLIKDLQERGHIQVHNIIDWQQGGSMSIYTPIGQIIKDKYPDLLIHLNDKLNFRNYFVDKLVKGKIDINDERFIDSFDKITDELNQVYPNKKQGFLLIDELLKAKHFDKEDLIKWPQPETGSLLSPISQKLQQKFPELLYEWNKDMNFTNVLTRIIIRKEINMNDERLIEDFNNIINELNKICKNNEQGTYFFDELRKKGHFKDRDLVKWNWPQEGATTVFSEMGQIVRGLNEKGEIVQKSYNADVYMEIIQHYQQFELVIRGLDEMLNQGGYESDIIKLTLEKLFASKRGDSIMDDEYSMPYKILALKETHWGLTYRKDLNQDFSSEYDTKGYPVRQGFLIHFPDGTQWTANNGDTIKEFNPNLPDFQTTQQMGWQDLTQALKEDKEIGALKEALFDKESGPHFIQLKLFQQMMHELSFRFQKRIEIGQFMGYGAEDILKAVNTLEFDRYAMRNADKSLLDKQFYQFRCYLYHNSKKS